MKFSFDAIIKLFPRIVKRKPVLRLIGLDEYERSKGKEHFFFLTETFLFLKKIYAASRPRRFYKDINRFLLTAILLPILGQYSCHSCLNFNFPVNFHRSTSILKFWVWKTRYRSKCSSQFIQSVLCLWWSRELGSASSTLGKSFGIDPS